MTLPVKVGDRIADKYTVEAVIGEGGMGVVVAARHEELEQRVAIKVLLPEIAEQGTAAERFRREARSAARIRSEYVCRVLDVGTLDSGVPYLVMEHLEGRDLAAELEKRGRIPVSEAAEYLLQACEGLAEAHAAGIVHRDIKPGNLYLAKRADGSRRIKVLDFGVSKALDDSGAGQHQLTQTAALIGSPLYMSPEQLGSSRDVDARADIWALGVVLFELVWGKPPFGGGNIPQLVNSVINETTPLLEQLDPSLPKGLDALLARALEKERDARYASIAEFAVDLGKLAPRHALTSVSRISRMMSPEARRTPVEMADTEAAGSSVPPEDLLASKRTSTPMAWSGKRRDRTGRGWLMPVLLVLVLAVGGAAFWLWPSTAPRRRTPEPYMATPAADQNEPAKEPGRAAVALPPEHAPSEPSAAPSEAEAALAEEQEPSAPATEQSAAPAPAAPHKKPRPTRDKPAPQTATTAPAAVAAPAEPPLAPEKPKAQNQGISDFGGRR